MKKIEIKNESLIKKIVGITLIVLVFSFLIGIICVNKDPIFSNEQYYSQTELDKKNKENYDKGFTDGINSYEDLNKHLENVIDDYNKVSQELEEKQNIINQNNEIMAENRTTIIELQAEVERLQKEQENNNSNHSEKIEKLQNEISSLQLQNQTILNDNATNLANIAELNKQIVTLQTQITNLTNQIAENENKVNEYEENKNSWLNSIEYYESFISALETDTQAVAIFEVNGRVYNAQIINKGSYANVDNPTNTDTMSFIGWYVNDELVDINTYAISTNIKFVAKYDITFNVKFMLDDGTEFTTTKVLKNNCAMELEDLPTKDGYDFDGFTLNGVDIVDYTIYPITQDTTFIAKFTKVHTIKFISDNEEIHTEKVRNNEYIQENEILNLVKNGYDFDGYTINGVDLVDYTTYPIVADITFVAKFTKLHTVIFSISNEVLTTQVVRDGGYAQLVENENVASWSYNGQVVDFNTFVIDNDITFVANILYSPYGTWTFKIDMNEKQVMGLNLRFTINLNYSSSDISNVSSSAIVDGLSFNCSYCNINKIENGMKLDIKYTYNGNAYVFNLKGTLNFDKFTNQWSFVDNGSYVNSGLGTPANLVSVDKI